MAKEAELQSLQRQVAQLSSALENAQLRETELMQDYDTRIQEIRLGHDAEMAKAKGEIDSLQRQIEELRSQHTQLSSVREDTSMRVASLERNSQSLEKEKKKLLQQIQQLTESNELQVLMMNM